MRPALSGRIGPPHEDTANMAAMVMTSAPARGESLRCGNDRNKKARTRD